MTCNITVEIEGQDKPALVAESIVRRYFAEDARCKADIVSCTAKCPLMTQSGLSQTLSEVLWFLFLYVAP